MITRILLLLILTLFISTSIEAQCTNGTEPSCQCDTAPVLCINTDLDGYTYGMSTYLHPSDGPEPMCAGSEGLNTASHNPTWIAFVASCTDLTLEVAYDNCISNPNSCSSLGIQAAVYSDCSLDPTSAVECDTDPADCIDDSSRTLALSSLTIGDTYYLLVDGCCGSACDIEISVIGQCGPGYCGGCSDGTEPSCKCNTADVLASHTDLDGFIFDTNIFLHPADGPEPMCAGPEGVGTLSNNPTWVGFVADCTELTLEVAYDNCMVNSNSCTALGIEAAVYSDCSLTPASAIACDANSAECMDDSLRTLELTGLTVGATYYLLVDGCCGSACDIEVSVVCSCGNEDIPNWTQTIVGDDDLYMSSESIPYSIDPVTNGSVYHWYVDGVEVSSGEGMITYDAIWSVSGQYNLCVDVSSECVAVESLPNQLCKSIFVRILPTVEFELSFTGFTAPVDIANAGDERLFIVEQAGYIRIIENGVTLTTPFLDIDSKVSSGGERGLLGLAFHPDYDENGYFFVNYYSNAGNTIIARYQVSGSDPNMADVNSEAIMITIDQPFGNHNAGDLNFSPNDGYLHIAMGDGGSGGDPFCYAQDSMSMLGKMLRIDVDENENTSPYYAVPDDNPFVDVAGALDEIYQLGLRNPWRFVFDDNTGDLWIADVGQGVKEEVNYLPQGGVGGENFGWKVMEGTNCYDTDPIDTDCPSDTPSCDDDAYTDPIFEYGHDEDGGFSITGGYMLGGCEYPYINGLYISTDYVSANSWLIDSDGTNFPISGAPNNVSTYGIGDDLQVYLATLDGDIYRVNDGNIPRVLYITLEESPVTGNYQALDSIIVSDNVTIAENQIIILTAPVVKVSESVFLPSTSELIIVQIECDD